MLIDGEPSSPAPAEEVRGALERALASPGFASKRRGELLRYLVERALSGASREISEYSIALDVFGKPETFDPRKESTVRAEMSRVRKALAEYYGNGGSAEAWRFEFPAGGYAPAFVRASLDGRAQPKSAPPRWPWAAAVLVLLALAAWLLDGGAPALRSMAAGLRAGRAPDPDAVDLVLRARTLRGYGMKDKFDQAVSLLDQAIQKDPKYGEAYAELASTYAAAATNSFVDPIGAAAKAAAAAARALQLDPSSGTAYAAQGYIHAMVRGNWKQGEQELRTAMRLLPQDATIHQHLGLVLLVQGRFREALAEARTSAQLDPLTPAAGTSVGMVYFMERQYAQALEEWQTLAALHPDAPAFHSLIGMALEAQGDYIGAGMEYDALAAKFPLTWKLRRMHLLAVSGQTQQARLLVAQVESTEPTADALDFAATYGALGERDRGFQWLERACDAKRSCWMLKVHPFLDPLRSDPRFPALLKRAGLG